MERLGRVLRRPRPSTAGLARTAVSMPTFTHGFVREVSRSLARCELTHVARGEFDIAEARRQHAAYVAALTAAGVKVNVLPEVADLPDSTFVEDPVVLLDEVAIVARPGAASRRAEVEAMRREIAPLRPLVAIEAPGTLEGGDVLRVGRVLYVGRSSRTNRAGIEQLAGSVAAHGYRVVPVEVAGCLHLKTGATSPGEGLLLANPDWVDVCAFADLEILPVPKTEPWGANTLPVNGRVLAAQSSPATADLLEARGLDVVRLDVSELQKAEAGLTCLSVLYTG